MTQRSHMIRRCDTYIRMGLRLGASNECWLLEACAQVAGECSGVLFHSCSGVLVDSTLLLVQPDSPPLMPRLTLHQLLFVKGVHRLLWPPQQHQVGWHILSHRQRHLWKVALDLACELKDLTCQVDKCLLSIILKDIPQFVRRRFTLLAGSLPHDVDHMLILCHYRESRHVRC